MAQFAAHPSFVTPPSDEVLEEINDQLDAEFAAREPGTTPITLPPPAPVDIEALDRFVAELVRG
jgi:hypothetical protein